MHLVLWAEYLMIVLKLLCTFYKRKKGGRKGGRGKGGRSKFETAWGQSTLFLILLSRE